MKLYTPDNTELIEVTSVTMHEDGVQIEGTIMGTMPMKAVLRPGEFRSAFRFLTPGLAWSMVAMLFRRR
jgi:hypothetical protein